MDLNKAKKVVGDKVSLFGNVPVDTIFKGSVEEIENEVEKCVDKAGDSGYILSSSCGLHSGTPFNNLHALVNYAKKYKTKKEN